LQRTAVGVGVSVSGEARRGALAATSVGGVDEDPPPTAPPGVNQPGIYHLLLPYLFFLSVRTSVLVSVSRVRSCMPFTCGTVIILGSGVGGQARPGAAGGA